MTQYVTTFQEYTLNTTPSDWNDGIFSTSGVFYVRSKTGATEGKVLSYEASSSGIRRACVWNDPGSISGDVDIYARAGFTEERDQNLRIMTAVSGAAENEYGYFLNCYTSTNTIEIGKYINGVAYALGSVSFTFAINTYYHMRLQRRGSTIQAKVWADTLLEPGTWAITKSDSHATSYLNSGHVGVGTFYGASSGQSVYWDIFGVGTGADVAPRNTNTPPTITTAPTVNYGITYNRLGTGNTPIRIYFTATDAEQTAANQLSYEIRTSTNAVVGSGTCTSGVEKEHQLGVNAANLVNGSQTLYLRIFDGVTYSTDSSFIVLRDTIAPVLGTVTYQHEYGE